MNQDRAIDIIKKLFATASGASDSSANQETINEALQAAKKAQELLIKFKIDQSKLGLDTTSGAVDIYVPTIGRSIVSNPFLRQNAKTGVRQSWFEQLAELIAETYFCKTSFNSRNGGVSFYGLDIDREIAIFLFEKLSELADKSCKFYLKQEKSRVGQTGTSLFSKKQSSGYSVWPGNEVFSESFHKGFREALKAKFSNGGTNSEAISESAIEKSNNEVLEFRSKVVSQANYRDYYGSTKTESIQSLSAFYENNEYAIEIGKNSGFRVSKLTSKVSTGQALTRIKTEASGSPELYLLIDCSGSMSIDCSGSMSGSLLDQAKDGAIGLSRQKIADNFKIGLISFHSWAEHRIKPTAEFEKLEKQILSMKVEGSTNMADALITAMYSFSNHRIKRIVCVITDGMPDSVSDTLQIAEDMKRDNIEIMAIGTAGCNQAFLDQLTSKGKNLLVGQDSLAEGIKKLAGFLTA